MSRPASRRVLLFVVRGDSAARALICVEATAVAGTTWRSARGGAGSRAWASHHHDHVLATPVTLFGVGERLRGVAERERPVNHGLQLAGLDDALEEEQVHAAVDGRERDEPLAHEP